MWRFLAHRDAGSGGTARRPSRGHAPRVGLLLGALLACALPAGARAQVVGGTIRERDNGTPLRAALVVLMDSAGKERGATLTDGAGAFVLRAPAPGRYRVRAEHIGHESTASALLDVGAGATVRVALQAEISPVLLQPIQVAGQTRCRMRPAAAEATSALWEEARKALRLSRMSRTAQSLGVHHYHRTVDGLHGAVLEEDSSDSYGTSFRPFGAESEDSLHALGYLRTLPGGGRHFFAPDEEVLLSEGFLEHHCIALREDERTKTALIGVTFRGVGGKSEIEGVLWLDRTSAELRSLDFHYRLPWNVDENTQGGHLEFTRLPSGAIAVTSWYLRMPTKLVQLHGQPQQPGVALYEETGGSVIGAPPARPPRSPARP